MRKSFMWPTIFLLAACKLQTPMAPVSKDAPTALQLAPAEEEALLSFRLQGSDGERMTQTLPGAWDLATIRLEHTTALTAPRLRSLTKGVEIVPNGSGGYVANGSFGGKLRPRSGYTLYASLWNGGASGTLVGERKATVNLVSGVNNVTLPIELYPALGLTSYTPGSGVDGDTVTLVGSAFSVVPTNDLVTINSLAATVSAASSVSLSVTVPDAAPGTYPWQVQVGGSLAARIGFTMLGTVGSVQNWVTLSSQQKDPAIAWGSDRYLVVWYDDRISGKTDVFGRFVSADGTSLTGDINITSATTATQQRPYAAYNPNTNQFLVVWQESPNGNDIQGHLINADGTLVGAYLPIAVLGDAQTRPQVTYNATRQEYFAVWTDHRNGSDDVYGQRVSAAGAMVGSNLALRVSSGNQKDVGIAYSSASNKYLVIWEDDVPAKRVIRGNLLNPDGSVAAGPIEISGLTAEDQRQAAVEVDSTTGDFLVVWHRNLSPDNIVGQRISSSGSLVGASFVISSASSVKKLPRLAYEPWRQKFLVVWSDDRSADTDVYGQYVSIGGSLWGSSFGVNTAAGNQTPCEVAASPTAKRGMVTFQDPANGGNVYGQVVR